MNDTVIEFIQSLTIAIMTDDIGDEHNINTHSSVIDLSYNKGSIYMIITRFG